MAEPKRQSDLSLLKPETKKKFELFIADAKSQGLDIFPFETLRTKERQARLYAQGRTRPGKIITRTLESRHLLGEAVDIVFNADKTGKTQIPSWSGNYSKLIEIGKKYGLDNLAPKELCHFQDNNKHLLLIDIIMGIYEKVWNDEVKDIPEKERVFQNPQKAIESIKVLPQAEQLSEVLYLLGVMTQRLKK